MRLARALLLIVAVGWTGYLVWNLTPRHQRAAPAATPTDPVAGPANPHPAAPLARRPVPVALNRSADVLDGFRGDVHPLLRGPTRLEVAARWTRVGTGRDELHRHVHQAVYALFTGLRPAQPSRSYTARDFSAFLPETVGKVGQLWALDPDKVAEFLKQFYPRPSMHLVAYGRRAGPDGAFGILRAESPSYLDIAFRIHAEFYLTPDDWDPNFPIGVWYTPACLAGTVLVNKQTGTVDYFRLGLPTDKSLNVHLTVEVNGIDYHDIVRVEHMDLAGGDDRLPEEVAWTDALQPAVAQARLAKLFYKSREIDWVPFDQAQALAQSRNRPIFAVVSWGAFDDQSC
jgi:hypothetical protein